MNQRITISALALALAFSFAIPSLGQQPSATPPVSPSTGKPAREDQQEPIKVNVEEVQIPIAAFDTYGRLDPTVELSDLLILENGVRQEPRSARRVPSSVLLLLDTRAQGHLGGSVTTTHQQAAIERAEIVIR
jgi:hypothetical protein